MGGRGSSNPGGGTGGGSGRVSVTSATKTLNAKSSSFAEGNAPSTITINGVKMTGGERGQYVSNGGYVVRSYQYTAENQIAQDGRNSITFNATNYKTPSGEKADGYKRNKAKVFGVQITGRGYSSGSSGGISRNVRR